MSAVLGIELGSTRIKACLVDADDPTRVIAVGSHEWENEFVDRRWTYSLDAVWNGLQSAYADLVADASGRHGVRPETFGSIGVSAMMHGYLAFDADGELLVPFVSYVVAEELHGSGVLAVLTTALFLAEYARFTGASKPGTSRL